VEGRKGEETELQRGSAAVKRGGIKTTRGLEVPKADGARETRGVKENSGGRPRPKGEST